ncbi:GNAT family N-acetyltransferase [Shewanella subflava]|uniref:GNAT family N-acetyltransferase n=1 Tax=Shewanella subflava TaxID=2986476 RepID=A0ABT3I5G5_9GAMM|nr:GNAT family N-acetyltransferase [Shewanella subflava]MCW3171301.1 GNAT family N-acetyltransferase [Shewanella subflava]
MTTHDIVLLPITVADLPTLFTFEQDSVANQMADFPPRERAAFFQHWQHNILGVPDNLAMGIWLDGMLIGSVLSWHKPQDNKAIEGRLIGYWIDRRYWGQGIATQALQLFFPLLPQVPLFAYIASHNVGSLALIKRYGFVKVPLTDEQRQDLPQSLQLYQRNAPL